MWIAILAVLASLIGYGVVSDTQGRSGPMLRLLFSSSCVLACIVAALLIFGSAPWTSVQDVNTPRTRGGLIIAAIKFFNAVGPTWTGLIFLGLGAFCTPAALAARREVKAAETASRQRLGGRR